MGIPGEKAGWRGEEEGGGEEEEEEGEGGVRGTEEEERGAQKAEGTTTGVVMGREWKRGEEEGRFFFSFLFGFCFFVSFSSLKPWR